VALALAVPTAAYSQATAPAPRTEPSLRTFFIDLADDARRLPSNQTATTVAFAGVLSTSASTLDAQIALWDPEDEFKGGTWIGNSVVLATGTLATYGVAHVARMPLVKAVAVDVLRAQALSLGVTYGLKYIVGRERPDQSSEDSFPSGHTAQTFASAAVLARYFDLPNAIPAFGVATYIALSRLNQNRHFLSDVTFGAGIGIAVGWSVSRGRSNWNIAPALSRSGRGVRVSRVFGS
jgi:membrane-associated phospholipid phosphatase